MPACRASTRERPAARPLTTLINLAGSAAWPCPTARGESITASGGSTVALGAYLGLCFGQALDDLPASLGFDLYLRFLGWLPQGGKAEWHGRADRWRRLSAGPDAGTH